MAAEVSEVLVRSSSWAECKVVPSWSEEWSDRSSGCRRDARP